MEIEIAGAYGKVTMRMGGVELATGVTGRVLQNINSEPALMDIRLVLLRINLIHRDLPTYA